MEVSECKRERKDAHFGFEVPLSVAGIDARLLSPRDTWGDTAAYDAQAHRLVQMFIRNFAKFETYVGEDVRASAPAMSAAA